MAVMEYDFQANLDVINELKEVKFFFKDEIEIDPEEYIVTHAIRRMINSICDDECCKYNWFDYLTKFRGKVTKVDGFYCSDDKESAYKLAEHMSFWGNRETFSFDFKDEKEFRLFQNNFASIFSYIVGEVQLISGRNSTFFESVIKALKLGAIPYDYQDGKLVVCVPKENYVPVSKPSERIIIDVSGQDDDFDMENTGSDYEASFDREAFSKANVGDLFTMGKIAGVDISWQVLDVDKDGAKLVISKDVIDVKSYIELDGIKSRGCVAWKDSKLRKWLNSNFLESIIPNDIHNNIKEVLIKNKKFPHSKDRDKCDIDSNDTMDKIFCLNIEEANKYFDSDQKRMAFATTYAESRVKYYAYRHFKNIKTGGVKWWLRENNFGGYRANYNIVDGDGSVSDCRLWSSAEGVGVRPAMWIKL